MGERTPHAPKEPLPELVEFMQAVGIEMGDSRRERAMERYVTGLLTEHPNKNCDTLAQVIPGTSEQRLQALLTTMDWDEEWLNRQRVGVMQQLGSEGDGVLIFDPTDFPKQGRHSVGVARQYAGSLGKVANCQVTVNCHYAERTMAWPVATRLFLPREWAEDLQRREAVNGPPEVGSQTKAELALALLDQANAMQIRHTCVVADAEFGDDPGFLDRLEAQDERYVVDVRRDFTVSSSRHAEAEAGRAEALIVRVRLPKSGWRMIRWREGSTGDWLRGSFAQVRCWRVDGQGRRHIGWLIAQRELPDGSGRNKYHWSNFPACTPLERMVELAHRRHHIEQFHEEAKTLLGWDQYQGRQWQGFHRHAIIVMLAYSFLVWLEWRQRHTRVVRGRPRRPLSPSQGSSPSFARHDSSPHRGRALARSHSHDSTRMRQSSTM